jgi:hypothetical protein
MSRLKVGDLIPLWKKAPSEPYTRPADWLALPEVIEGDQKVVGLHAVFPHDSNFVAFRVYGAYTVDWGDGSASKNYSSGAYAYHKFDYDDLGAETECVRGYRQAIVTITPQTGQNLTSVDFNIKHNQSGLPNNYSTSWLDVKAAGAEISTFGFGASSIVVRNAMLEIFEFVGSNKITNFSRMFYYCYSLQSIPHLDTSGGSDFSRMFYYCYSLQSIPHLDTSGGSDFSYMFYYCCSLQSIPHLDTSGGSDFSRMFYSCFSLPSIPHLDTSGGSNFSYMFGCCYSLQSIPQLDTSGGGDFGGMFYYCYSLQSIPHLDTSGGSNFSRMFYYCYSLQSIPHLDTSGGSNFSYMFNSCYSLPSIPQLDTSGGSNLGYMFGYCYSLSSGALSGTSLTISYSNCRLSRQALVDIFNGLATVTRATITITGNWGAADLTTEDRAIATNKGWTIAA